MGLDDAGSKPSATPAEINAGRTISTGAANTARTGGSSIARPPRSRYSFWQQHCTPEGEPPRAGSWCVPLAQWAQATSGAALWSAASADSAQHHPSGSARRTAVTNATG